MMITRVLTIALLTMSMTATAGLAGADAPPTVTVAHSIPDGTFASIDASDADDVWAVGGSAEGAVALRFDGRRWRELRLDRPEALNFYSVAATGENTAWALGRRDHRLCAFLLKKHKIAAEYPLPEDEGDTATRYRVDAEGGQAFVFSDNGANPEPYALRFDGARWQPISVPRLEGERSIDLHSAAVVDEGDVWFTGSVSDGTTTRILVAREHDGAWERAGLPDRPDEPGQLPQTGDQIVSADGRIHVHGHSQGFRHSISYHAVLRDGVWTTAPLTGVSGTMHGFAVADDQAWLAGARRGSRAVALVYRQDGDTWTRFALPPNLVAGHARAVDVTADADGAWALINSTLRGGQGESSGNIVRAPR